jgi:hypothetical protein
MFKKQSGKIIIENILSDVSHKGLNILNNLIVVFLKTSCVHWGFLAQVGQFKTRVKQVVTFIKIRSHRKILKF